MMFLRLLNLFVALFTLRVFFTVSPASAAIVSAETIDSAIVVPSSEETDRVVFEYVPGGDPFRTDGTLKLQSELFEKLQSKSTTTHSPDHWVFLSANTWRTLQAVAILLGVFFVLVSTLLVVIWLVVKISWLFLVYVFGPTCVVQVAYQLWTHRALFLESHAILKLTVFLLLGWVIHNLVRRYREHLQVGPYLHRLPDKSTNRFDRCLESIALVLDFAWEFLSLPLHSDRRGQEFLGMLFCRVLEEGTAWKALASNLAAFAKSNTLVSEIFLLCGLHPVSRQSTDARGDRAAALAPLSTRLGPMLTTTILDLKPVHVLTLSQYIFDACNPNSSTGAGYFHALVTSASQLLRSSFAHCVATPTQRSFSTSSFLSTQMFSTSTTRMIESSSLIAPKVHQVASSLSTPPSSLMTVAGPKLPTAPVRPATVSPISGVDASLLQQPPVAPLELVAVWGSAPSSASLPTQRQQLVAFNQGSMSVDVTSGFTLFVSGTKAMVMCLDRPCKTLSLRPYTPRRQRPGKDQRARIKKRVAAALAASSPIRETDAAQPVPVAESNSTGRVEELETRTTVPMTDHDVTKKPKKKRTRPNKQQRNKLKMQAAAEAKLASRSLESDATTASESDSSSGTSTLRSNEGEGKAKKRNRPGKKQRDKLKKWDTDDTTTASSSSESEAALAESEDSSTRETPVAGTSDMGMDKKTKRKRPGKKQRDKLKKRAAASIESAAVLH